MTRNVARSMAALGLLSAGLILSGCAAGPTGVQKQGSIDHVVIIVEENKPAAHIIGSSDAPFINQLAAEGALATNYSAITNPSLPNYIALTSGSTAGISTDCAPSSCSAKVPSIARKIEQAGRTWKMYAESMPAPCTDHDADPYAVRHNPFLYYPEVTDDEKYCHAHDVPFSRLAHDLTKASTLPDYVFISPNVCNDMHDCPVRTGDDWLAAQVPKILSSPAFTEQNSLLVITWDEGEKRDNTITTIFAGPAAKSSYSTNTPFTHYSLLHTIESDWGIAPLTGKDKNAPVMDEMLRKSETESPTPTP
jgi:phospholipase C